MIGTAPVQNAVVRCVDWESGGAWATTKDRSVWLLGEEFTERFGVLPAVGMHVQVILVAPLQPELVGVTRRDAMHWKKVGL